MVVFPPYVQPIVGILLVCMLLYTVSTSFIVSDGNIKLGSTNKYINMKTSGAIAWIGTSAITCLITPGKLCATAFVTAVTTTVLSSVSNVPTSTENN